MGNISFLDAVKYVLKLFSRVPSIIIGNVGGIIGNISNAIAGLSKEGTHTDISANEDKIYSSFGTNFWMSALSTVVTILVSIITLIIGLLIGVSTEEFGGVLVGGALGGFFGFIMTFASVSGSVFNLVIASLVVYFGKQYSKKLNMTLAKVLIVFCFVAMLGSAGYVCYLLFTVLISLLSFSIGSIITSLVSVFSFLVSISNYAAISGALGSGNGYNLGNINTNNYDNTNYGNTNNNTIDINKNLEVNNSDVQMYACPYCGKAIYQNQSPCPHCNQVVNW